MPDSDRNESARARIVDMAADLMADLREEYGEGAEVLDALLVVEVLPDDHSPGGPGSIIEHRATSARLTTAVGLAAVALESLTEPYSRDAEP